MSRFTGKVAIVTGAGTGLGPVMARMLVAEGAKVVLAARRFELVERVAKELGDSAIPVRADVTQEDDVSEMVDTAMRAFGQVDVMMNNAAQPGVDKYIWEQTLENWNNTIAVDLTAAMLCSREVIRRSMFDRKTGSIVNFSSTSGLNGQERKSHYTTAKAGLRTLTKVIALEAGPHGIRANCVVPGKIDGELYRNWIRRIAAEDGVTEEQRHSEMVASTALGRISTAENIARAALFLASDDASTITGQSLVVDGGEFMPG